MYILNFSIAIYVSNKYIPNKYVPVIRKHCGERDAKQYSMRRYEWKTNTINNVEWTIVVEYVDELSHAKIIATIKYLHRWISLGNNNFNQSMIYYHCKKRDNPYTDHNHFLSCPFFKTRKKNSNIHQDLTITSNT